MYKELIKEWNWDKNGELVLENITIGMNKKVWWKCSKCGYEWQTVVYSRTNGNGCPVCSNSKVQKGYNDLFTKYPKLCEEWDYEKNIIKPTEVSYGSQKYVWWKCKERHEWRTTIHNRTKGTGCPICYKIRKSQK